MKYLPAVLVSGFVLLVLGGAIAYGLRDPKQAVLSSDAAVTTATASTGPISQQPGVEPQSSGSSLNVSGSSDLGSALQGGGGYQSSGANGGGSSSASNPFDPTTFAQYDKYKTGQSGLMADIVIGTGDAVTATSKVSVTYRGWLTNGTLFDQSRPDSTGRIQPFSFQVGAHTVIPGWEQDIVGMKVGGRRMFIVPPAVGYGENGQNTIPGNAVLIFDVSLIAVQ